MMYTVGNLLKNKKIKINTVVIFAISFVLLTSCGEQQAENDLFHSLQAENVVNNLGKEKEVILEEFNTSDEGEASAKLAENFIYNEIPVEISFEFLGEKLFRVRYDFGTETESAFMFIDELMSTFEEKYGKSDTYETMPDRIAGLTIENYLKDDIAQYKEYWIDSGVTFEGMVPEEYQDTRRIDLGIGIYRYPYDEIETTVYVGGIVNDTGSRRLENEGFEN